VVRIPIENPADTQRAAQCARELAVSIGFSPLESEQLAIATTELASNLVKHAGGGSIQLTTAHAGGRTGICIESQDTGPGIADIEQALTDGYSTAGSLGLGLGAVNRLMDDLELRSVDTSGAHIVCHRWLRSDPGLTPAPWVEFGAATRALRNQRENGDAFLVRQWAGNALAAVIDGLGHGQFAQRAALTARRYIDQHFDRPLVDLFRGAARACQATRGVVMALARFDDRARTSLTVASLGNINVRVFGAETPTTILARRGVVGLGSVAPLTTVCPWTPGSILIMHSDGLHSRWNWQEFSDLAQQPAQRIAERLLSRLAKPEDDATVLVARGIST
jgi:anti-sigma regulatory factor (Ser/Thr protein kinase)/serine/threonine protein phosphatase PrpC